MSIRSRRHKPNKEKMSKSALDHASIGKFSKHAKTGQLKMQSGGHGKENLAKLKSAGIDYEFTKHYPNGVRCGNVENHNTPDKKTNGGQTWFPSSWSRRMIKKSAEKLANSVPYKLQDGRVMFGTHKGVKIGMIRTKKKIATVFPHYKQSGGKKNVKK